ncbi:VanW family protein [Streptomyces sp. BI20]|uniref:VanW family protein n=1 Tax=Streptomyces sp. BI20 TaxID=3403460 RepID=UPI003C760F65
MSRSAADRRPAAHARRRRPVLPLVCGAAVLGFGGLYAAGLLVGDDIPEGTSVRGVAIGGMSRSEAREVLTRELGAEGSAPLPLRIGERTSPTPVKELGLALDAEATADAAARSGNAPWTVVARLFSGGDREVEPVVTLDEKTARSRLAALEKSSGTAVREGSVTFSEGAAKATEPRAGIRVNVTPALDTLRTAWPRPVGAAASGAGKAVAAPVEIPVTRTRPKVDKAMVDRAVREFGEPAMSAPITLKVGEGSVTVAPGTLSKHLTMKPGTVAGHPALVPALDAEKLLADPAVAGPLEKAGGEVREATLRLDGTRVAVAREGVSGRQVTPAALGEAVVPLLTGGDAAARTGTVATREVKPKLSSATLAELGIKEKMSSFTVNFEPAEYRRINIGRAAELINGSLVMPNEEWSFNKRVGERTEANGFTEGIMINDGRYVKAAGGGVSAVATTMFNAMFFAGVKPVEYGAHSFYIERYPEGREATVAWGSLDLRFRNDSGKAIYVQAEATDRSVTISFLGTKKYDEVRATKGPRTNVVKPAERTASGRTCEAQSPLEGFDVAVDRIFVKGGAEVGRETFKTHYTPRDKVTCEPEKSPTPSGSASAS